MEERLIVVTAFGSPCSTPYSFDGARGVRATSMPLDETSARPASRMNSELMGPGLRAVLEIIQVVF